MFTNNTSSSLTTDIDNVSISLLSPSAASATIMKSGGVQSPQPPQQPQRSVFDALTSFAKGCGGDVDPLGVSVRDIQSPPSSAGTLALRQAHDLDNGIRVNNLTGTTTSPPNSERKRRASSPSPPVDYTSDDDREEGLASSLLNLFQSQGPMKKFKLLGNAGVNATSGPPRIPQLQEVHITQPSSMPTSPISSPRPPLSSPTPLQHVGGCHQHHQHQGSAGSSSGSNSQTIVGVGGRGSSASASSGGHGQVSLGALALSYQYSGNNSISTASKDDGELTKIGLRERNAEMCNNELMADVYFIVSANGGEVVKYPAHKYVLAIGSTVFFAMFYGSLAETGKEIVVPDVEPEAFLKMLQFLYSDEINLDEDCVLATLHVGKKYIIPQLAKACVQFLESSLTARNACILLSQSRIFDEPELMERCWEVIDAQAELALTSEGFLEIDHSTLESILSRETLKCKELSIFNATMAWATAECERRGIEETPGNLRASLGNALQLIRVPTMDLKEFADGPAQTGIFSLEESHSIFLHFTATSKPKVGYPTIPRAGLTPQVCHRFQSSAYRSNQWRYRGRCDSIQFCVDRRVFIVGFGLYGSSGGAATYAVHIELKRLGRILAENDTEFFSDGSSNTFHVYFGQPVQVDPDTYYTASAVLDGLELSYFGQEGLTDVSVGNVTFQFQCSAESTNGTGVQGGQIPELIFYGPSESSTSVK